MAGSSSSASRRPAAPAFRLPTWQELLGRPESLRRAMNLWPPYRFAGVRVVEIAPDYSRAVVSLKLTPFNRNYVGTQFGGSLFSMADPFWMLLVMNQLGRDYVVWDQRAEIEFVRPGKGEVRTEFVVDPAVVERLREAAAGGAKVLEWFENDIVDVSGQIVARVRRQLYVRRKRNSG
jgi:acyl-coenzyme A thioesterase PaaI-like protein